MPDPISPVQLAIVRDAVRDALSHSSSSATSSPAVQHGADRVSEENLDPLIAAVRRTTATRIEPFVAQVLRDICRKCPFQFPSAHCSLRCAGLCTLHADAVTAIDAIANALIEIGDPVYLAAPHGSSARHRMH